MIRQEKPEKKHSLPALSRSRNQQAHQIENKFLHNVVHQIKRLIIRVYVVAEAMHHHGHCLREEQQSLQHEISMQ